MIEFPFSAIVGQETMKLALLLGAVNPRIGGVLISGARGSGKSRAARALAGLLPPIRSSRDCRYACDPAEPCGECDSTKVEDRSTPFVSLPIGATEDRVLGTIDLESAVRRGEKRFEPGLLARAHRGVLYVDEVNLLPDHLVDVLLDVAASGVNVVEREGVSLKHPSRFLLVGTMNPDEGELRPQLLDRFSLFVTAENVEDPSERAEIARRVVEFEADPEAFAGRFSVPEARLRERIVEARRLLPEVAVPDHIEREIATLCCRERVEGLRADIVIRKAAAALAAWERREAATDDDVERVAELALAHRRREPPEPSEPPPAPPPTTPPDRSDGSPRDRPEAMSSFEPSRHGSVRSPESALRPPRRAFTPGGRRGRERSGILRGPYARARLARGPIRELALDATLRAAALRAAGGPPIEVRAPDLREKVRQAPLMQLVVFVVDASRSMAARRRMSVAKGALLGLLDEAYRKRDSVALVVCRGTHAALVLPPTRSIRSAQEAVRKLAIGGRTPLAHGLRLARESLAFVRRRRPDLAQAIVLVSDGRPTAGLGGLDPVRATERELSALARSETRALLVDTEEGALRLGLMRRWARRWTLPAIDLDDLSAGRVRRLLGSGGRR